MDRSLLFNNAGALALRNGHKRAALELFRGALETKLEYERLHAGAMEESSESSSNEDDSSSDPGGASDAANPASASEDRQQLEENGNYQQPPQQRRQRTAPSTPPQGRKHQNQHRQPECVIRAENHLLNLSLYSTHQAPDNSGGHVADDTNADGNNNNNSRSAQVLEEGIGDPCIPYENRGFNPFIYLRPFELPVISEAAAAAAAATPPSSQSPSSGGGGGGGGGNSSTQVTSAIIVFNLGLVHHAASRRSAKASAFYEIAAALLSSEPISPSSAVLRVAIMNNFGVWCYENGDGEALRTCMEHLSTVLEYAHNLLDSEVEDQIKTNIDWLITPPNGGSPAA